MKYFTLKELCKSATATRYGIDNTPTEDVAKNLNILVYKVLDPLRDKIGIPVIVNSAYRCKRLNELVGGSKTSQHLKGQAADIQTVGDKKNRELFELAKELEFDQLIWEYGDDTRPDWVHISYCEGKNRHQILRAVKKNGVTSYIKIS